MNKNYRLSCKITGPPYEPRVLRFSFRFLIWNFWKMVNTWLWNNADFVDFVSPRRFDECVVPTFTKSIQSETSWQRFYKKNILFFHYIKKRKINKYLNRGWNLNWGHSQCHRGSFKVKYWYYCILIIFWTEFLLWHIYATNPFLLNLQNPEILLKM